MRRLLKWLLVSLAAVVACGVEHDLHQHFFHVGITEPRGESAVGELEVCVKREHDLLCVPYGEFLANLQARQPKTEI